MKLLREPLVTFVLLGVLLFGLYAVSSGAFSDPTRTIVISESEIDLLATTFRRQWQRPPTESELRALVDARVREEVLYREALAVGLDRNDVVVRRRMVQKMELLSEDLATLADPTDAELKAFLAESPDEYREPPRVGFSHVFFNLDRRGAAAEDDALRVLAELRAEGAPSEAGFERGDRFMLEYDYAAQSPADVQRLFGIAFAEALFELEPGWQGPVTSGYGLHLVHVGQRVEGFMPDYEDIRDRLVSDFNRTRRNRANEVLYQGLVAGYDVQIDEGVLQRMLGGSAES